MPEDTFQIIIWRELETAPHRHTPIVVVNGTGDIGCHTKASKVLRKRLAVNAVVRS
jgi:hypothetical protein